jgi:tetratricopeptide (TPR) repeat protein
MTLTRTIEWGLLLLLLLCGARAPAAQETPQQQLRRAAALFDQRRFEEAAELARRAHHGEPGLLGAWKLAGLSLQLSGKPGEAETEFAQAIIKFPKEADLWFYLARVQYIQSRLLPSETSARRAVELDSEHAGAHTQLGMTLELLNNYENALKHYRRGVELNARGVRATALPLASAGALLLKLDRVAEALDYFNRAAAIEPQSKDLQYQRAQALERLGRLKDAESAYSQAAAGAGHPQARAAIDRLRAGLSLPVKSTLSNEITPIRFRNIAAAAKLDFTLRNDATGRKFQIETMTGGVAVLDYDLDGWPDLYFVNGASLPSMMKSSPNFWNRLYRNNRDGTFSDVTAKTGTVGEGYSMGAAVADYDNDGDPDLFIAGVDRNLLFRNEGGEKFIDVTAQAGLSGLFPRQEKKAQKPWSVAAAWFDHDNDGDLDLFVVNYCRWTPDLDPYCGAAKDGWRTYCYPDRYEGLPNQLFRNNGDGSFTDVSAPSGVGKFIGKGMGVAVADYDDDGWMDVFVANDTLPNFLFRNNGRGGFDEVGLAAGVAVNDSGKPVSGMGVDFRDYDNDGLPDLILSALEGESFPLFRNLGKGFFVDATWQSGLGSETVKHSGWGLGFVDFNNDGWKDLFTANAHVNDNIELYNNQTYRQPNSVFANLGNGAFRNLSADAGVDFQIKRAHRGSVFADFDNDGRIDVVTTSLNEPVELWRNESAGDYHWLKIRLIGARSNRDGIGAKIKLLLPNGEQLFNHTTTSVGYASSSDVIPHFGLGKEHNIKQIEIRWPSGIVQTLQNIKADRILEIKEDAGVNAK